MHINNILRFLVKGFAISAVITYLPKRQNVVMTGLIVAAIIFVIDQGVSNVCQDMVGGAFSLRGRSARDYQRHRSNSIIDPAFGISRTGIIDPAFGALGANRTSIKNPTSSYNPIVMT